MSAGALGRDCPQEALGRVRGEQEAPTFAVLVSKGTGLGTEHRVLTCHLILLCLPHKSILESADDTGCGSPGNRHKKITKGIDDTALEWDSVVGERDKSESSQIKLLLSSQEFLPG